VFHNYFSQLSGLKLARSIKLLSEQRSIMGARRGHKILLEFEHILKSSIIILILAANGYETSKNNLKIFNQLKH